jgi:hypothetical protein
MTLSEAVILLGNPVFAHWLSDRRQENFAIEFKEIERNPTEQVP